MGNKSSRSSTSSKYKSSSSVDIVDPSVPVKFKPVSSQGKTSSKTLTVREIRIEQAPKSSNSIKANSGSSKPAQHHARKKVGLYSCFKNNCLAGIV